MRRWDGRRIRLRARVERKQRATAHDGFLWSLCPMVLADRAPDRFVPTSGQVAGNLPRWQPYAGSEIGVEESAWAGSTAVGKPLRRSADGATGDGGVTTAAYGVVAKRTISKKHLPSSQLASLESSTQ